MSEISKCKHRLTNYLNGNGVDLGCDNDKVNERAIGVDRHWRDGVNYVGDVMDLPFKDNILDYVLASHLLEDLKYPVKALSEWFRVLKRGGYMILVLPHGDYYPKAGSKLANKAHLKDWWPDDVLELLTNNWIDHIFDIVYNKTFAPPGGVYDYENRGKIEYHFIIVVRKR